MALFNRKKQNTEEDTPKGSNFAPNEALSPEEQMLRHQSAPRPTAESEAQRIAESMRYRAEQEHLASLKGQRTLGVTDGFKALAQVIGKEQIRKANTILQRYREGKKNLEQRIVDNEQWYKLRHWECMRNEKQQVQPTSAWLFNCIANKHADAMDNFPSANVLPREEGDKGEAEMLTSIIPVVLDQNEFEATYSDVQNYKLKMGTGVYGVFWDKSTLGGLGDILVRKADILNLFWEPGITDIQRSRNLFHLELCDNEALEEIYPQLRGKLSSAAVDLTKYIYDDTVDTTTKSLVIDWYYKKSVGGRVVLHYVKYVNDEVLFATENDQSFAERGWYDHGLYPFVFDPLFPTEGTPTGFGYIDIGKSAQEYVDRGNQAIMQNMLANAKPRHFIREDGGVNEEEYADLTRDFIHVAGGLGQDSILPVQGKPLSDVYVQVVRDKIDELKETTGNRDVSNGGTSGATAASAIAAMQEAGSKLSRDANKASYRAFRKVCLMIIELMRQFYDTPRRFRILGENGAARYVQYSNAKIAARHQGTDFGIDLGDRYPLFDIEVTAQKQSPYSKMSQNELALQFYKAGFFNPQMVDQAMACLDMMDFDRKQFVMQKVAQNGGLYQQLMAARQQVVALASVIDKQNGTNYAEQFAAQMGGVPGAAVGGGVGTSASVSETEALGGGAKEASSTKKARQRVAESTSPT